jgi:hypothetical protein
MQVGGRQQDRVSLSDTTSQGRHSEGQYAFVKGLYGKFRDECLNRHWFRTMEEARVEVMQWQH